VSQAADGDLSPAEGEEEEISPLEIVNKLPPDTPPELQRQLRRIALQVSQGPLPPPNWLREYADMIQAAPERFMAAWEGESQHRREMDRLRTEAEIESLRADNKIRSRGQWFALIVTVLCLGLAAFMVSKDEAGFAALFSIVDIAALAGVFISSRIMGHNEESDE
jgi:uncharacterized membrane protein